MTALDALQPVLPVVREHAADVDRRARFPEEALEAFRGSGLLGLLVPTEQGGMGGGLMELTQVADALAAECPATAMNWAMHCQQVDTLVHHAGQDLADHLFPRIARGEVYLASVTTEPGKGGHLLTGVAPITEDGNMLHVDRIAPIVTGGEHADGFLITMRASEASKEHEVSLIYADLDQLMADPRDGWETLGMRGSLGTGMHLSGKVPQWQVVGEPGGFRSIAVESLAPVGHIAWVSCWLGAARGAFSRLVGWLRKGGRKADIGSELLKERLARIRMDLELVSAYLHRVREEVHTGRVEGRSLDQPSTQIHLNTLKVTAAELTFRAVDRMVQVAGLFQGYRSDSDLFLERTFRDLRSASLNYADDRLLVANGALILMDRTVRLA